MLIYEDTHAALHASSEVLTAVSTRILKDSQNSIMHSVSDLDYCLVFLSHLL